VHADAFAPSDGWRTAVAGGAASADHLTYTADEDIEAVGRADTVAVLIPTAELYYFTDRKANARKLIEAGVPVAITTDYCGSIHTPCLSQSMPLGAAWFRMTPEEVISSVTVNAAWSLRMLGEIGTLEPGKRADLVVADVPDFRMLAFEMGVNLAETVVVDGRVVVRGS
jgi:imidazolonepropionase